MSHLPHQRLHTSRGDRAFLVRWGSVVLLLIGSLLLAIGSCSSGTGPPAPGADAAGTIDRSAPADSATADGGHGTRDGASVAEPSTPMDDGNSATRATATQQATKKTGEGQKARSRGPTPAGPSPAGPSPAEPSMAKSSIAPSSTAAPSGAARPSSRSSIVVPSFEPQAVSGPVLPAAAPVSLTIPAISVSAPVSELGLLDDGSIEVPPMEETNQAGWYTGSPAPGEQGPSVILGHVDSARNGPSVFYELGTLSPGDEVSVTRNDGTIAVFRIEGVREYGKNDFPTDVVYGNLDHAGLRLITCGGTFDPNVGHYESNVIAFASLISSHRSDGR